MDRIFARLPSWAYVVVVPAVAAIAVILTEFGSGDSPGSDSSAATPDTITIRDFAFVPSVLDVKAGTTITVTNADGSAHTVTAVKGAFDTGSIAGNASAQIAVDEPGTYAYFCEIHQYMKGMIHVDR